MIGSSATGRLPPAGFLRNAAGLLATNAALVPIELVIGIVVTRFLTVEERGLFSVAGAFAGMATGLVILGWPPASIYRLRRVGSPPAEVATAALLAITASSAVALVACWFLEPWMSRRFFNGAPPVLLYLAAALIPCLLTGRTFGGIARGLNRFRIPNLYQLGLRCAQLVAFPIALVGFGADVIDILVILLSIEVVAAVLLIAVVIRETGLSQRVNKSELLDSFRYGFKNYLQTLADRIHERIDIFMIAALLGDPGLVAFYTVAGNLVARAATVPETFAAAAFPQLAGSPPKEAARFTARLARNAFAFAVVASAGLAAIVPFLIAPVYGAPYRASIEPFLILIPAVALRAVPRLVARFFMAIDRQQINIAAQLVALATNIGLNLIWIPRYGILGAAGASLVSYGLEAVVVSTLFILTTRSRLRDLLLLQRSDLRTLRERLLAWRRPR